MKISSDINCFYKLFSIEETITILAEAGCGGIDFSFMDNRYYNGEISDEECKKHYTEVKKFSEDKGICISQAHAPCPSSTSNTAETEARFNDIVRAMRNASYLGAELIVVHPMEHIEYALDGAPEQLFEINMDFYNRLKPYCEEYGIKVGVENIVYPKELILSGDRLFPSVCSDPDEYIRYMDTLNSDCFLACFDIGHCVVAKRDPAEVIRKLGKRLKALHIHDGDGVRDVHTIPFLGGAANWDKIIKALKEVGYSGNINFEAGNFLKSFPRELYPAAARMMVETGQYLSDRIKG